MAGQALTAIRDHFAALGCAFPDIGLLQPADPFLDTAGEDIRRRIFITADRDGNPLCLRPEFTIPVCLAHLASGAAAGRYAYGGSVFRQRREGPAEFTQAGMEVIGGGDALTGDVEIMEHAVGALAAAGAKNLSIVVGDHTLFEAMLDALALPPAWRQRLGRAFGDDERIAADLQLISANGAQRSSTADMPDEIAQALQAGEREPVLAWVGERMADAGLPVSGGRTADEICDRALQQAELAASRLSGEQLAALSAFLAIETGADELPAALEQFQDRHKLDLGEAASGLLARLDGLRGRIGEGIAVRFNASFGRRLDYYTGLVFEMFLGDAGQPVCGGGRYDRLAGLLGAKRPEPAVGFSIWLDRLEGGGR